MAYKRYDNQDTEKPLYLYKGHEYTDIKHYINRIQAILDNPNKTDTDKVHCYLLYECANILFGLATERTGYAASKKDINHLFNDLTPQIQQTVMCDLPLATAFLPITLRELLTRIKTEYDRITIRLNEIDAKVKGNAKLMLEQYNNLQDVKKTLLDVDKTIFGHTTDFITYDEKLEQSKQELAAFTPTGNVQEDEIAKERIQAEIKQNIDMLNLTKTYLDKYRTIRKKVYDNYTGLYNVLYDVLADTTNFLMEYKKVIQACYKYVNAYDIYIDILADTIELDEIRIYKYDLYEQHKRLEATNEYIQALGNAINGKDKEGNILFSAAGQTNPNIDTDEQKYFNSVITANMQKAAKEIQALTFKLPNRNLRPAQMTINAVIDDMQDINPFDTSRDALVQYYLVLAGYQSVEDLY